MFINTLRLEGHFSPKLGSQDGFEKVGKAMKKEFWEGKHTA